MCGTSGLCEFPNSDETYIHRSLTRSWEAGWDKMKMKIKLLTRSCDLNKILMSKLNQMGLTTDENIVIVDDKQSLLPQVADAEIIVNGFGNIDKTIIDGCPNLQLIQQTGIGIECRCKLLYIKINIGSKCSSC